MKLKVMPVLACNATEYEEVVKSRMIILDEMDLCPARDETRKGSWNCDTFEDCSCCPFGKANGFIQDALRELKSIHVEKI